MFTVNYGFRNRAHAIRDLLREDYTTPVILAAVHFEWTIKRAILALGSTPTVDLRKELEDTYKLTTGPKNNLQDLWNREIKPLYNNAALGKVIPNFPTPINEALTSRGRVIHGNGTVPKHKANEAVTAFLEAADKIYAFAEKNNINLDSRLKTRRRKSN